jgi:queuine/archaeosine tRNA-ribosyltransferase
MVDSGGFQSATRWIGAERGGQGTGRYPYSATELHDWAERVGADIVAGMDIACEDAAALFEASTEKFETLDEALETFCWPGPYEQRVQMSLRQQRWQYDAYREGDYSHKFMPVVQGQHPDEYAAFCDWLVDAGLGETDWLGIGTVCKREQRDEILAVVRTVRERFPDKRIHLFGATKTIFSDERFYGLFDSADTAAWHWGASSRRAQRRALKQYVASIEDALDGFCVQSTLR